MKLLTPTEVFVGVLAGGLFGAAITFIPELRNWAMSAGVLPVLVTIFVFGLIVSASTTGILTALDAKRRKR